MSAQEDVCKEQIWAEIRDLLEFKNGPVSVDIRERMRDLRHTQPKAFRAISKQYGITSAMEFVRSEMIARRTAMIAALCNTPFRGNPPSVFLYGWADNQREVEVSLALEDLFGGDVGIRVLKFDLDFGDFGDEDEDDG